MIRLVPMVTVVLTTITLAAGEENPADAVPKWTLPPEFYLSPDRFGLFNQRLIHEELNLTKEERTNVGRARFRVQTEGRKAYADLLKLEDDKLIPAYNTFLIEQGKKTEKSLREALPPRKYKRFREVVLQMQRCVAFYDPAVAKELKLTKVQRKKLEDIQEKATVAWARFHLDVRRKRAKRSDSRKRRKEIDDKAEKRILQELTEAQRKQYKQMLGKPLVPRPTRRSIILPSLRNFHVSDRRLRERLRRVYRARNR